MTTCCQLERRQASQHVLSILPWLQCHFFFFFSDILQVTAHFSYCLQATRVVEPDGPQLHSGCTHFDFYFFILMIWERLLCLLAALCICSALMCDSIYLAKNWPATHLNCIPASEDPCQKVQSGFPDCLRICWGRHHWDQMTGTEFFLPLSVFIHGNQIQRCKISKGRLEPGRACQFKSLFPLFWFKNK